VTQAPDGGIAVDAPVAMMGTGGMGGDLPVADAAADSKTKADAKPMDAAAPSIVRPTCGKRFKEWAPSFTADPTKEDLNADGKPDWSAARGTFALSQLKAARWEPSGGSVLLDTAPQEDFATRTLLFIRMQNKSVMSGMTNGLEGAIAWLNLDNKNPSRIAVYLRLVLTKPDEQTLFLQANGTAAPLGTFKVDSSLQDLAMEADPKTLKVRLWIENIYKGEWALPRTGTPSFSDDFATVGVFFGSAVFEGVRIEQCAQ
jgi:hypothetical protein